jgi:hypothetical protein
LAKDNFELISLDEKGKMIDSRQAKISGDGNSVIFVEETNMGPRQIYLYDRFSKKSELISKNKKGDPSSRNVNSDERVRNSLGGISFDGRFVSYTSNAMNLVDPTPVKAQAYVYDRLLKRQSVVSMNENGEVANLVSSGVQMDIDGRVFLFESRGNNLIPNDTNTSSDVFIFRKQ